MNQLPFDSVSGAALDDFMSRPTESVMETVAGCEGDIAVLGANGKMGLHLCLMLHRALEALGRDRAQRVLAVSRFGSPGSLEKFESLGFHAFRADLSNRDALANLPAVPDVFFLAGVKFGTSGDPALLQNMNVEMPSMVANRFRESRIVALSTGCVYSFVTPESGGSTEEDPTEPVGAYARSCLGREEAFRSSGLRSALIRLNYAIDLRYGVLVDIAQKVMAGEPVDVTMGHVNVIWQGDALAYTVQALAQASAPPFVLNVTGPGVLRVRDLAGRFGEILGREPVIIGEEAETAWLNNPAKCHAMFSPPRVSLEEMIDWIAAWLRQGGSTLGKPTHFETRDGNY
jgi:nucleoside-diphosphate-sugar epimerase